MDLFSLKNKFALEIPFHKSDSFEYSPSNLATINYINSKNSITFSKKDGYFRLQNSYISLDFEVKNNNTRYADGDQISLVNFGPVASFIDAQLVTSSGKHLENVDNLHIMMVCLMYKFLTSNPQTYELLFEFEESENTRRQELTNKKTGKGIFFR